MSTGFYANLAVKGEDTTNMVRLHLGKTTNASVMVDSNVFPSFKAMLDFLRTTNADVTVEDEYGTEITVDDFAERFYRYTPEQRAEQHNYVQRNPIASKNTTLDQEGFTLAPGAWF